MSRLEQSAMHHDKISDKSDFDRAFDAAFSVLAFVVNRHLIHHMLRATRTLGVDYETLIVWGVLAHQNVAHLMPPGQFGSDAVTNRGYVSGEGRELRPVRIRDLSQITGIPRETVRRKLETLAKRGFVCRYESAGWIVDRRSMEPDLREFTRESVRQLLTCANQVHALLDKTIVDLSEQAPRAAPRSSSGSNAEKRRARGNGTPRSK
jgi:DNA-binding transcriptional regulator YhcF (GntR family)